MAGQAHADADAAKRPPAVSLGGRAGRRRSGVFRFSLRAGLSLAVVGARRGRGANPSLGTAAPQRGPAAPLAAWLPRRAAVGRAQGTPAGRDVLAVSS